MMQFLSLFFILFAVAVIAIKIFNKAEVSGGRSQAQTVSAKVLRIERSMQTHTIDGRHNIVLFELQNGTRLNLAVEQDKCLMAEGDKGKLTYYRNIFYSFVKD